MSFSGTVSEQTFTTSTTTDALVITFPFRHQDDLVVTNITKVPSTILTLTTDFVVAGGGRLAGSGGYDTGTVTLVAAGATTAGNVIRITRNTKLTQELDFANHSALSGPDLESAFDLSVMAAQDRRREDAMVVITLHEGGPGVDLARTVSPNYYPNEWICPWYEFTVYDIGFQLDTAAVGSTLLYVDALSDGGIGVKQLLYSTKPTFDSTERTTDTALTPAVLNAAKGFSWPLTYSKGERVMFEIQAVGETTAGSFLQINLYGKRRISLEQPNPT